MSNSNLDVIIIGGGPAGTATAITCAKNGLKVLIIEGKQFPRHRPGETLHSGIEPLLKTLGVIKQIKSAGFLRHEGKMAKRSAFYSLWVR
ncbi:FAD-dependent oxidoreductase [Bacillus toyonensis]|uniref:FAD-dependent oxidoreductase n=1 Tax=Bacillus toyonensis TaxID=155322 RepID=UPI0018D0AEC9|nr:FAD-dependent oxidoreductase [Bacillus toyonensis]